MRCGDRLETVDVDERGLGVADTEDLAESVGAYLQPGSGDRSGLTLGAFTFGGVYEDVGGEAPRRHMFRLGRSDLV